MTLIEEGSAAAVTYASEHDQQKTLLVVDVGAGGGAVTALNSQHNIVQILASSKSRLPGGIDIDEIMMEWLIQVISHSYYLHRVPLLH